MARTRTKTKIRKKTKTKNRSSTSRLPIAVKSGLSAARMTQAIALVLVVGILAYVVMKGDYFGNNTPKPENSVASNMETASETLSKSQVGVISDKMNDLVNIQVGGKEDDKSQEGNLMEDIKHATKGDGIIRDVDVNAKPVDSTIVKLAMFENQDFQPRLEDKGSDKPYVFDKANQPQRSHFRPMSYPLVWSKGAMGTDNMRETEDTRVNVAADGGRY